MAKNNDGLDYSDYFLKKHREGSKVNYNNQYYDQPSASKKADSNRVTALIPDEIDEEPYVQPHTVGYVKQQPQLYENASYVKKPINDNNRQVRTTNEYSYNKIAPEKKRKKNKNPLRRRSIILVVLTIFVCFGITLLIADSVSGGYMLGELQSVFSGFKNVNNTYYALEMSSFSDMATAKIYSNDLRLRGGGGYVINDGLYRVIGEVYPTKKDAESVSTRLNMDGDMTKVIQIEICDIDYQLFPTSVRNLTKKTMVYADNCYKKLYDVGCKLAKNELDTNSAHAEINTLIANLRINLTDYEANADNKLDDNYVMKVRAQLNAILGALTNLVSQTNKSPNLLCDIRYTNAMLINTHYTLCKDLLGEK